MVAKKEKGFTLVEALVSLTLLAVLLLGLLGGLVLSYEVSIRNILRDEAVKIASEYMEAYRDYNPQDIPDSLQEDVNRQIRNKTFTYTVNIQSQSVVAGYMKIVTITVTWTYKGQTYTHKIETLVGKHETL